MEIDANTERRRNLQVREDIATMWMILGAMALTAGLLLWLLRA